MATGFLKNPHRIDPYKNFKFRVIMNGQTVLGVSKVSALKRTTEVVKHRDGGMNSSDSKSPGRSSYDAITMERGITHDPVFANWANSVHAYPADSEMKLDTYKQPLTLEVMNEKGHVVHRYFLFKCWVSEYIALPEMNANANAIAIETIKIEIEGWQHDSKTQEPDEATPAPPIT